MSRSRVSLLTLILIFSSYLSAFVFSLRYLKAQRCSPIVVRILGKAKSLAFTRQWVWSKQIYITGYTRTPCVFHSSKTLPAFRCVLLRWQLHLFIFTFLKKNKKQHYQQLFLQRDDENVSCRTTIRELA